MSAVRYFEENTTGRDFVVGDIHGCFAELEQALASISFSPESGDRLFSVGDLVDRGLESEKVAYLIGNPWFHAVRGNHEQMAIDYCAGQADPGWYVANGGCWFIALSVAEQKVIADSFSALPIAIQIGEQVGIVHAEPPGRSWPEFLRLLELGGPEAEQLSINALWSRSRVTSLDKTPVSGIGLVFSGHTPMHQPLLLGNVLFIDTGCVFGRSLTLRQIQYGNGVVAA